MQSLQHDPIAGGDAPAVQGHAGFDRQPARDLSRQPAPIVRNRNGARELAMARWGFPPPQDYAPVTNTRNVKSPFWRGWLKAEYRCRQANRTRVQFVGAACLKMTTLLN